LQGRDGKGTIPVSLTVEPFAAELPEAEPEKTKEPLVFNGSFLVRVPIQCLHKTLVFPTV
jgi:hypothetical protein